MIKSIVILFYSLMCMNFGALQAGPIFSKEATIETVFRKYIMDPDGYDTEQIMIVNESDLYEHVRNSSQAKIYSSDDAIQQFVFKNCVKNFERAINYEIKDITFLNNFNE